MKIRMRLDSSRRDSLGDCWSRGLGRPVQMLQSEADGRSYLLDEDGRITGEWADPLDALTWLDQQRVKMPGFRWVGYLGYDLGRWFEAIPQRAIDDLGLPLLAFTCHELLPVAPALPQETAAGDGQYRGSSFTAERYHAAVARAIEYIAAGDIFQVNLSQRFHAHTSLEPDAIYARAQHRYPAWFGALLQYEGFSIVCNSPELFLRTWRDESGQWRIVTRPIKGTRPRQSGMARELLESAKDQAELNMIVDLERNDLGRICQIGSVRVTEPRTIEIHPTVYHGAATVEGTLRRGVGLVDVLGATFPGGSITGAPKIRAMQIIDELEPKRRGPYCGAIGLLDADGSIMLNVAIRIMVIKGRDVWIPVGGGIVADSTPQGEYDETLVKARAAMAALGIEMG